MIPTQKEGLKPVQKFILVILIVAVCVGGVLMWLHSSTATAPSQTEHTFGDGHARWTINPYAAKVLHNNTFTLKLNSLSGLPLQGADISVKLEMLNMICGDYAFNMQETSPGSYQGEGVPLMAGMWRATAIVQVGDESYTIIRTFKAVH